MELMPLLREEEKKKMGGGNFFKKKCRGGRRDSWVELECGRFHGPTGRHPRQNEVGEESEMAHVFGAGTGAVRHARWGSVLQSTHARRHKPMPILGGRVRVGDGMNHWSPRPWEATRTAPQAFGGAPVIWSRRGAVLVPHVWTPPPPPPLSPTKPCTCTGGVPVPRAKPARTFCLKMPRRGSSTSRKEDFKSNLEFKVRVV
jgi:hypothetical protein